MSIKRITIKCPECSSIDLEDKTRKGYNKWPRGFMLCYKCNKCGSNFDLHVKYEATV